MKLLFDQNLSYRLVSDLRDIYPGSTQARLVGLDRAADAIIWQYAKDNNMTIVSLDSDFAELAALHGSPPKVIWLRCGNQPSAIIEKRLRDQHKSIASFFEDTDASCMEIY